MPRWHRTGALIAATVVILAGCNAGPRLGEQEKKEAPAEDMMVQTEGGLADTRTRSAAQEAPGAAPAPVKPAQNAADKPSAEKAKDNAKQHGRYIIRSANVTLQVGDVRQAMVKIHNLVSLKRGFVSDSNLQAAEGQTPSAVLTLRVPTEQFDAVLDQLSGVGQVRARRVSGEDVTVEFVDTGSRIRNLQREEAELLKLLGRTGKLSEILEVEREVTRVRGEIEQAQGRLRQLASLVDLATIEVTLSEAVQVTSTSPWQLGPVFENAWANAQRELAETTAWVIAGLVWLVAFVLPVAVPALLLFLLVGWALRGFLVDRQKLLSPTLYNQLWAAAGVALLALAYPPLLGLIVIVAVIAAVIWVGSGAFRSFQRKSAYKD